MFFLIAKTMSELVQIEYLKNTHNEATEDIVFAQLRASTTPTQRCNARKYCRKCCILVLSTIALCACGVIALGGIVLGANHTLI